MKIDNIHRVYFLGIGGIGMSALARYFLLHGKQVFGYDLTPSDITSQLAIEGAHIHFDEDIGNIPENVDLAVFTPAVKKQHAAYQYFKNHNISLLKRSEVLGMVCQDFPTIAVAGTHGKTTTTAMITQILANSNYKTLSFIGGIAKNFDSNIVFNPQYETVIVEADEYDRSFLSLRPQIAIITSIDADHLDVYGTYQKMKESFQLFANQIQPSGTLVIYDAIADQIEHPNKVLYGFSEKAKYRIDNTHNFPLPGKHNALNAMAALAACIEFSAWRDNDVEFSKLRSAFTKKLSLFKGVKRRFDIRIERNDFVYIDDYAHHPEAIIAFLEAVKSQFPNKKLTGIFQPHLYSRTRDFAHQFANALEVLDEIILLDVYPAREEPIEGISSGFLLSLIKNENKKILKKGELISYLRYSKPEILLTMGAGDIDKLAQDIESIS